MASLVWAALGWLLRPAVELGATSESSSSVEDLLNFSQEHATHSPALAVAATQPENLDLQQALTLLIARLAPLALTTDDLVQSDSARENGSSNSTVTRDYTDSQFAPVPSLSKLPTELLRMIVPDPATLHGVRVEDDSVITQRWLAFKREWRQPQYDSLYGYYRTDGPHHTLQTLRALSRTCHALRALALPRLWAVVHVRTVREMAQLHEVLREAPYLVPLIRHFGFFYDLNGDFGRLDYYPDEHGTLLDMAFIDRGALWERTRQGCKAEIELEKYALEPCRSYFYCQGQRYREPGHEPLPAGLEDVEPELASVSYDSELKLMIAQSKRQREPPGPYVGANEDRSGPDGRGADRTIKNVSDFNRCLGEIADRLSALEVFVWACPCAAMPPRMLEALKRASSLKKLHLLTEHGRKSHRVAPYWEVSSSLEALWLETTPRSSGRDIIFNPSEHAAFAETGETTEEELATLQLVRGVSAQLSTQYFILYQTIVAAAKGGRLRRLILPERTIQRPFAVRTLLPCWVGVEEWHHRTRIELSWDLWHSDERWSSAAAMLRLVLAHASLWLPESRPGARDDRLLTGCDVRSLHSVFDQSPPDFSGTSTSRLTR